MSQLWVVTVSGCTACRRKTCKFGKVFTDRRRRRSRHTGSAHAGGRTPAAGRPQNCINMDVRKVFPVQFTERSSPAGAAHVVGKQGAAVQAEEVQQHGTHKIYEYRYK